MTESPVSKDGIPFQCSMCGECCSSISIPVEADKAEALLAKGWVRDRLKQHHRTLEKVTDKLYRLPLTDENVCVFLGENGACLIEHHEGLALKPEECKNYPFAGLRMPDGTAVYDTSASCKTVAGSLLSAFKPILPMPGREPAVHDLSLPKQVPINAFRKVSLDDYLASLETIREVFMNPDIPALLALKQAQQLINALPGKPGRLPETYDIPTTKRRQATLLFLRKPYGAMSWWELLTGGDYHDSRLFGDPLPLKSIPDAGWPPEQDMQVKAYLYNLLQRKALVAYGIPLTGILGMAAAAWCVVRWYGNVLAGFGNRAIVTAEDAAMAIRLSERYYTGHQPRFLAFFTRPFGKYCVQKWLLG